MAFSKIILNNQTLMDVTTDTVEASKLLSGETATAASGQKVTGTLVQSNDFVITLTKNQSDDWEPDCTFAEAVSAYNAGKNIAAKASTGDAVAVQIRTQDQTTQCFFYIEEYFTSGGESGFNDLFYQWTETGMERQDSAKLYFTENADAVPANVLSGKKFYNADGYQEGTIALKSSSDLTASGATVTAPAGYYANSASKTIATGSITAPTITIDSETGEITASTRCNAAGYVALNTVRSSSEQLTVQAAKTVTPTESSQTAVAAGKYTTGAVTVAAIPSNYIGSGVTRNDSDDLTVSGATVTVPVGYYAESASKAVATTTHSNPTATINSTTGLVTASHTQTAGYVSAGTTTGTLQLTTQTAKTVTPSTSSQTAVVAGRYTTGAVTVAAMPSGTAGTPTATKGTVSNNSVSVTPSVTNSTGYITGGTKTGTAVTVSASELVSGTKSITENGEGIDVTNYASVDVDVQSSGGDDEYPVVGDGKTYFHIQVVSSHYPTVPFNYYQLKNTSIQLDWGDASAPETISTSSTAATYNLTHDYTPGKYTITLSVISGTIYLNASDYGVFNSKLSTSFQNRTILLAAEIGGGVQSLYNAFPWCRTLRKVTFTENFSGRGAFGSFENCYALSDINIPATVQPVGYCFSATPLHKVVYPNHTSIAESVFSNCTALSDVTIPNSVTQILGQAFQNCASLASIVIPDSVTNIRYSAFQECYGLLEVTIPASVTNLGNACFAFNSSVVPRYIHVLATTPPTAGTTIFGAVSTLHADTKIYVPAGTLSAYQSATNWATYASYMQEE